MVDTKLHVALLICVYACLSLAKDRPNIVIFLADDLGIGDVGCFGNDTIRTPHLDRMAREGVKLTQHFASASFCTPSRASLLTGRYPIRSGMTATWNSMFRFFFFLAQTGGLPGNETTFAELAKSVGYRTALIGKWHLGLNKDREGDNVHNPINHGFDYYYGLPWTNLKDFGQEGATLGDSGFPRWKLRFGVMIAVIFTSAFLMNRQDFIRSKLLAFLLALTCASPVLFALWLLGNLTILNSVLMRNTDVIEQPIILQNLTHRLVREGLEFLDERHRRNEPFLLMMSWQHVHTHITTHPDFTGKSAFGRYGDGIEEMDWGTGQILNALDKKGLGDNTFAYFSSDNGGHLEEVGAHGEQDGGWNGIYKGGKTHGAVEGGIRVPTIVRWPARIPKNTSTNEPTIFTDVLPTIANIIGAEIPRDRIIDGKDMMPLLSGKQKQTSNRFMVHYCGTAIHAVRYRPEKGDSVWKLVFHKPDYTEGTNTCLFACQCYNALAVDPPELHDITKDPSEKHPINYEKDSNLQSIVSKMLAMKQNHIDSMTPVPSQFSRPNMMWRYGLQPCCGGSFPFCGCAEDRKL